MLVIIDIVVVSSELASTIAQLNLSLMTFTSHYVYLFGSKGILGFRVISFAAHAYHNVILPAIFVKNLCFLRWHILEMIPIAALKINLIIML